MFTAQVRKVISTVKDVVDTKVKDAVDTIKDFKVSKATDPKEVGLKDEECKFISNIVNKETGVRESLECIFNNIEPLKTLTFFPDQSQLKSAKPPFKLIAGICCIYMKFEGKEPSTYEDVKSFVQLHLPEYRDYDLSLGEENYNEFIHTKNSVAYITLSSTLINLKADVLEVSKQVTLFERITSSVEANLSKEVIGELLQSKLLTPDKELDTFKNKLKNKREYLSSSSIIKSKLEPSSLPIEIQNTILTSEVVPYLTFHEADLFRQTSRQAYTNPDIYKSQNLLYPEVVKTINSQLTAVEFNALIKNIESKDCKIKRLYLAVINPIEDKKDKGIDTITPVEDKKDKGIDTITPIEDKDIDTIIPVEDTNTDPITPIEKHIISLTDSQIRRLVEALNKNTSIILLKQEKYNPISLTRKKNPGSFISSYSSVRAGVQLTFTPLAKSST